EERVTTATLLAHIAEVDARRLYVPAGYTSMHAYCVEELRLSEDAAYKRIQAARAAGQYPALFPAMAEGRLHLAAVCLLAPHLTAKNADELIEAATNRRKSEIEGFLARRFPPPDAPARVCAIAIAARPGPQLAPGQVEGESSEWIRTTHDELAPGQVEEERAKPALPSPERFLLEVTIGKSTHEKLRYAQSLLSHAVPTGDVAQVLDRALDALIADLEKRKFGAITRRPRRPGTTRRPSPRGRTVRKRYVPAKVRRAVWERDQGQCTFVGATGHRCEARRLLEFDHVEPVARGGKATVEGMRLRCRTHNQYEAERTFGAGFMRRKRQAARLAAAEAQARAAAEARARAAAKEQTLDVLAGLRGLGCRADQARRAAEFSEALHGATLEERMRASLKFLRGRAVPGPAPPEAIPRA
ncbi:MAG: HNH endonuclease signature motif containing protein, partial [Candidatus Eisenbacteria bacterium]